MDLALALGQPVGLLANSMSEREFVRWQHYAAKRMLPWRRMECYLAQIAQIIARTMGGTTEVALSDFLFEAREAEVELDEEDYLEMAKLEFGFKPRNTSKER